MEKSETNDEMKNAEVNGGGMKGNYGKFALMMAISFNSSRRGN